MEELDGETIEHGERMEGMLRVYDHGQRPPTAQQRGKNALEEV
jgi:hypothetical protein